MRTHRSRSSIISLNADRNWCEKQAPKIVLYRPERKKAVKTATAWYWPVRGWHRRHHWAGRQVRRLLHYTSTDCWLVVWRQIVQFAARRHYTSGCGIAVEFCSLVDLLHSMLYCHGRRKSQRADAASYLRAVASGGGQKRQLPSPNFGLSENCRKIFVHLEHKKTILGKFNAKLKFWAL